MVMNPQETPDGGLQLVDNPLKVMQPGERVLCEIKRHPFGLLGTYFSLALVIVLSIAAVVAAPMFIHGITTKDQATIALGAVIICSITALFSYVSITVYKGNRWIVTSDSITQISQISLFRKQTSQLSLANLEDVSVEQDGILESMFGFGLLRAETAGERSKFVFIYCPNPADYAKKVIGAHEAYIAEKPDEMHTTNQAVANTSSFNQSYGQPQYQYPPQPGQPPVPPMGQQAPYNPVQQQSNAPMPPQPYYNPVQQPVAPNQQYESMQGTAPMQPQQAGPTEERQQYPEEPNSPGNGS